ncbi:MAG: serine/threonine protein kinase [Polyangiaceae bacterium]|nr:serine/threonine protein kinase [Polyangiaceae bacterium]
MSAHPAHPEAGELVAGKYLVESVLGRGGMGVVVSAVHQLFGERVAIKFLLPEAAHGVGLERFLREAKVAFQLKSQHVVRVLDVAQLESGAPYIVMEHLAGEDLAALVAREGPLAVERAVDYVLQACEAIGEAHAKGIVHRDLKPSNLFLTAGSEPMVKVLDFGISKLTSREETDHALTASRAIMGSPLYMSPEQLMSARSVDHRTDIWSLGVILYELLTARTPFVAETFAALSIAIVTQPPAPMRAARSDLPFDLEALVLRCLAKGVGERPESVSALAELLSVFGGATSAKRVHAVRRLAAPRLTGDLTVASAEAVPATSVTPATRPETDSFAGGAGTFSPVSSEEPPRRSTPRRAIAAVAGAAVLVAGAVSVRALVRSEAGAPGAAASPSAVTATALEAPTEDQAAPPVSAQASVGPAAALPTPQSESPTPPTPAAPGARRDHALRADRSAPKPKPVPAVAPSASPPAPPAQHPPAPVQPSPGTHPPPAGVGTVYDDRK